MRRWSLDLYARQTNYSLRKMGHHQKNNRQTCTTKDTRCDNCSKQGHFAKCCRAKSRLNMVSEVELAETSSSDSKVFLGEVSANEHKPWTADIIVSQDCVTFKLDSGRYVDKCTQQQKWQKREHNGAFGKYGKNDNLARIANKAKHKAIKGPIKVGDTGKFGKYGENDNFARIANMAKHKPMRGP